MQTVFFPNEGKTGKQAVKHLQKDFHHDFSLNLIIKYFQMNMSANKIFFKKIKKMNAFMMFL
jgi:hypothetical protein